MKFFNYKLNALLAIIIFFIISSAIFAEGGNQTMEPTVAVVTKVVNDVKYKTGNGGFSTLKVGQTLLNSDEIRTGDKSLALVKFTDNSTLIVRDNASVKIYAQVNGTNVSKNTQIDKGVIGFNVNKQEDKDFKFTTPTMVASVRGTRGLVGNTEELFGLLAVEEGSVDVAALLGEKGTGNVRAGFYVVVGPDGKVNAVPATPEIKQQMENSKRTTTKKLRINTNNGDVIIEYYDE